MVYIGIINGDVKQCLTKRDGKMVRDIQLGIRLPRALKEALDKAAQDENRSVSNAVEQAIIEYLTKRGYWPGDKKAIT